MTRADAVRLLKASMPDYSCPLRDALEMAIAALTEEAWNDGVCKASLATEVRELRASCAETRAAIDRLDLCARRVQV